MVVVVVVCGGGMKCGSEVIRVYEVWFCGV